jgi:Domain of Unknown Function with PDB structure (DUF3857)/Transglutaminase-like superfamily
MLRRLIELCLCTVMVAVPAFAVAEDAPAWLRQAAEIKVPAYDRNVSVVVLVDESTVTVTDDGRVTRTSSFAVRILSREGRGEAQAADVYETDLGKVREMHAWLIRPSGQVKSYGKNEIIDEAELNDVYDESRTKRISAVDDAEPGAVFGYQTVNESRPYFNQLFWHFQSGTFPVLSSRLTIVLPAGWRANGITFNHALVEPAVNGTSYVWELRDIPPVEREPSSPSDLAPRLEVKYFPTEGTRSPASKVFESWSELSRWYTDLSGPQAVPDERIAAKARELTANLQTELSRIRALGNYVQSIQYISIQIGVGRWRPHSAAQVFAKSYGDCKDKANLMRAMLKSLDIESYPVLIFSGDPTFVREAWPSPYQFNHCIIAIKLKEDAQLGAVAQYPKLGRLLIFDATDEDTPVGDLPQHEQGSLALIAAGDDGALVRMPATPPEANQLQRLAEVQLAADGSITASIREKAVGQSAVNYRREFRHLSRPEYTKHIESWVTHGATSSKVTKIEPTDEIGEGRFGLNVEFSASAYGQLMQNRLLVFRPAIISRSEALALTQAKRKYPVVLSSRAFAETVRIKLPAGFDIDELPDAVKLVTSFGSYKTSYEVQNSELIFARALAVRSGTISPDQYNSVRSFFEKIRAAEQAPVVLVRK